jgi:hypothetical protein
MEEKYPLTTVQTLSREVSDHTTLLLNSGEASFRATQPLFEFELGCLLRDGFMDIGKDIWTHTKVGKTPMEHWQGKNS